MAQDCSHNVLSGTTLEKRVTLIIRAGAVECSQCGEQWISENKVVAAPGAEGPVYGSHNHPNWIQNVDPIRGYD